MKLDKATSLALIGAINNARPFLPPLIYDQIAGNPLMRVLEAVANGLVSTDDKPDTKPKNDEEVT